MFDEIVISMKKCLVINLRMSRSLWLTKGKLAFICLPSPQLDIYFQCVFSGTACLAYEGTIHFPTYSSHGPIHCCCVPFGQF